MNPRSLGLIASIALLAAGCFAPQYPVLKPFNEEYKLIRRALPAMVVQERDISGYSAEGGEAVLYRESSGAIRLIRTETKADMGKAIEEYYFKDSALIMVFTEVHVFNAPKYLTQKRADETGGEAFDPGQTQVRKNRYYFSGGAMVFWLGPDQKPVSTTSARFREAEEEKLGLAKELLGFF